MSPERNGTEELRDQSIGELFKRLTDDTRTLVRQEVELAKAELAQKGKLAGAGVGMLAAAGVIGFLAFAALTACLIVALDGAMPLWLAALVVAVSYAAIAAVLGLKGKDRVTEAGPPVPGQTVETVKEDMEWLKNPR